MRSSVGKASAARHFPSCLSSLKFPAAFQLSDLQPSDQAADTLFSLPSCPRCAKARQARQPKLASPRRRN
jgi:hypothetical protein